MGGSGRLGGESGGLAGVLSARAMAGLAAAQRKTAEEQEIEDACPSGRRGAASGGDVEAVVAAADGEEDGSAVMDVASVDQEGRSPASCCGGQHAHEHEHESSAAPSGPPPVRLAAVSAPAPAPAPATPPAIIAAPEAAVAVAMVDEETVEQLVALGFARAAVVAALGRAGGDVERAANLLMASEGVVEAEEAAPGPAAMAVGMGEGGGEEALVLDPTTREGRAVAAARRLVREELRGDEEGRAAALSTLKGMIQAVLVRFCVLVHMSKSLTRSRALPYRPTTNPSPNQTKTGPPQRGQVQARAPC